MSEEKEKPKEKNTVPDSIKESFTGVIQIIPVMETNPRGTRYFFAFFCFGGLIYCLSLWIQKPQLSEVKIPLQTVNGNIKKIEPTKDGNGIEINTDGSDLLFNPIIKGKP